MPSPIPPQFRAVVYARVSTADQADSIEQQFAWAEPASKREGLAVASAFSDADKSGHATSKRDGFHAMLEFCQESRDLGQGVDVIVCWHSNRFSRADSLETGWFLHEFRKAGVGRMLTDERWIYFERMEDRVLLGLEQDVSSNKFSKDLAATMIRKAQAGPARRPGADRLPLAVPRADRRLPRPGQARRRPRRPRSCGRSSPSTPAAGFPSGSSPTT